MGWYFFIEDCLDLFSTREGPFTQNDICDICYEEIYKDDFIDKSLTKCCHSFHTVCINEWLRKSATCPVCRHTLCHDMYVLTLRKNFNTLDICNKLRSNRLSNYAQYRESFSEYILYKITENSQYINHIPL